MHNISEPRSSLAFMASKSNSLAAGTAGMEGRHLLATEAAYRLIRTVNEENSNTNIEQRSTNICSTAGDGSETVCRICLVELREDECFRIDCSCKGDLAAAHSDCAAKWFTIRGKLSCDICGQTVRNLPPLLGKNTKARWDLFLDDDTVAARRRHQLEEDYEIIRNISWMETVTVYLSCALARLWRKLEELSEFP